MDEKDDLRGGETMSKRKRVFSGLVLLSVLILQKVPVLGDELITGDVIGSNSTRAGVSVFLEDSTDTLLNETGDVLLTESISDIGSDELLVAKDRVEDIAIQYSTDEVLTTGSDAVSEVTEKTGEPSYDFSMQDVIKLARAVQGTIMLTETEKELYDLDEDGNISMKDVMKLSRYVRGSISEI